MSRVLVVVDHNPLRISLCDWLKINFLEVHILEAKNCKEAIDVALNKRPHIILLDVGVSVMQEIEVVQCIRQVLPDVKIVILTMHENPEFTAEAKATGASDCIFKREMGSKLLPLLKDWLSKECKH